MAKIAYPGILILLLAGVYFLTRTRLENYPDTDGPLFTGEYAGDPSGFDGDLKVVSYNLHFSEALKEILSDLQLISGIDVLLLQEAHETALERISQRLKMNYVYFPASVHQHGRNFGNAILSRWPLSDPEKIILPHKNPRNGQIRVTTKASVEVGSRMIHVYSVHFETLWLGQAKRMEQIRAQVASITPEEELVVVGGDFNAITSGGMRRIEALFMHADISLATSALGSTTNMPWIGLSMDHIFSRGMQVLDAGVLRGTSGSDHLPIWVEFDLAA